MRKEFRIPYSDGEPQETIVCMGFAHTSRDLVPWDKPGYEFWSMNERYNWGKFRYDKITRHFQLHPYENFMRSDNRNDPNHAEWMKKVHPFPIYTQEKYDTVPSSVKFPLKEVIRAIGSPYMESSLAYMLGLALLEYERYHIIKRIEIYGFDMRQNTEYVYQRPNAEYLIGLLRGKGLDVFLPDICPIAKGSLYGYKDINTGFAQQLEFRHNMLEDQAHEAHYAFHYARGLYDASKMIVDQGATPTVEDLEAMHTEVRKRNRDIALVLGAFNENKLIQRAFGDFIETGGSVQSISWEEDTDHGEADKQ